jgi:hypothetical protein
LLCTVLFYELTPELPSADETVSVQRSAGISDEQAPVLVQELRPDLANGLWRLVRDEALAQDAAGGVANWLSIAS